MQKTAGCFESAPVKYINGGGAGNWNADTGLYKFIMNTGSFVKVANFYPHSDHGYINNPKFAIAIDINGKKRPNQYGKDIFEFGIRDGVLIPDGIDTQSRKCKNKSGLGYDCAWTVLVENKFPN